jgi:hypothetical protein
MNPDCRMWSARVQAPIDTDAIHPDSIRAGFTVCLDRLEAEADARGDALDWSTLRFKIEPTADPETSRLVVSARRLAP